MLRGYIFAVVGVFIVSELSGYAFKKRIPWSSRVSVKFIWTEEMRWKEHSHHRFSIGSPWLAISTHWVIGKPFSALHFDVKLYLELKFLMRLPLIIINWLRSIVVHCHLRPSCYHGILIWQLLCEEKISFCFGHCVRKEAHFDYLSVLTILCFL